MTDLTEIYEDGQGPPRYVARLSRTAQGVRTFTVGMSLAGADINAETVSALFRLERAITSEIDGPRRSASRSGNSVAAQLRRSLIVTYLEKAGSAMRLEKIRLGLPLDKSGWLTTHNLTAIPGAKRTQLVTDLSALVRDGLVEVEQSKGRTPSRYRLATQQGAPAAAATRKGKVSE